MITTLETLACFSICFEGFLFGNVSYVHLNVPLVLLVAKEIQLFPGLGIYTGIFAIYLQCPSDESRTRTANVVFYAICLLYVFCAAAVVSDLISVTLQVSDKFICRNIIFIISCAVVYQFIIASTSN